MNAIIWILALAIASALVYWLWRARRQWEERQHASEARMAEFVAQTARASRAEEPGNATAKEVLALARQQLLLEAAGKAAQADEPALAIQLYARVISRYPGGPSAALARTAVEAQKQRLAKVRSPDTSAPG